MDLLPTILGLLLVASAAAFVLLPLARGNRALSIGSDSLTTDRARAQIYGQVLELEFDYQMGKLSADDYHALSTQLLTEAGELMREERGELGELDEEIEREIAAARAAFSAARRGSRSKRPASGTSTRR